MKFVNARVLFEGSMGSTTSGISCIRKVPKTSAVVVVTGGFSISGSDGLLVSKHATATRIRAKKPMVINFFLDTFNAPYINIFVYLVLLWIKSKTVKSTITTTITDCIDTRFTTSACIGRIDSRLATGHVPYRYPVFHTTSKPTKFLRP